ncbi:MAG: oxidoreductase [Rhizobium sp.]|nr:oxidoreductase [Rhizobium sp.]
MRIAVIGTGVMGSFYARVLNEMRGVDLVAICGRSPAPVEKLSQALNVQGYANGQYDQLLADHPNLDAVVIATPDGEHLGPLKASVAAGCHILIEKPLGVNAREAAEMTAAAEAGGKFLMVCHHLRFDPRYYALAKLVRQGTIGKVINIHARRNPAAGSPQRINGRVPAAYWVGVHDIDLVHWITGRRAVRVISKSTGTSLGALGVDDCVVSTITLDDGTLFTMENSWATPRTQGKPKSFLMAVRGTEGVAEVDAYEHGVNVYTATSAPNPDGEVLYFPDLYGRATGVYRDMMDHFVDSVTTGKAPVVSGADGLAAVRVADAIVRSVETGTEVDVEWDA